VDNKPTNEEVRHRVRAIIVTILGILVMIAMVSSVIIYSNVDSNATAIVSSKKSDNKKEALSSSIKVDPIEFYNASDNKIMPQDDGTIIIEGKTAPNKQVKLDIISAATDSTNNVSELTTSDKEGYFKFNFDYVKDPKLVDILYCLDENGSVDIYVTNDNYEHSNKHLKLVRNENVDYGSFRDLHAQQHYRSHTHSSSDSSITIDAEITFE